jgi:hypothetical protein
MTLPRDAPPGAGAASLTTVYIVFDMDRLQVAAVRSAASLAEDWIEEQPIAERDDFTVEAHQVDDPMA